jgi:hypothetical protein
MYTPFASAVVTAGSLVVNAGTNATLTDLYGAFQFYKVNKINVAYSSIISTTMAAPCIYACMAPGLSPASLGTTGTAASINSVANSVKLDPHQNWSFTYKIPKTSDISQVGGNELQGGWLPIAYGTTAPTTTVSGIIAFGMGSATFPAPLTTMFGQLDIIYDIDLMLPE